jgi:hypothetical protein
MRAGAWKDEPMSGARSFRRFAGAAAALLGLAFPLGCATGGESEAFPDSSGGGSPDGNDGVETGGREGGTADRGNPPPFDGGVDTGKDTGAGGTDTGATDSGVDTTRPPIDSGHDAGHDAGRDTGSCVAVAVSDAGGAPTACPATGGACGDMVSLAGFSETWVPPAAVQSVCTTTMIDDIYNDCLSAATGSAAKCTSISTTDSACFDCIFTPEGASSYGPVIETTNNGLDVLNQAGCIEILEPCNMGCAEAWMGLFQCESAACEPNCPSVTTYAQDVDFQTCFDDVETCNPRGCDGFATEASNCGGLLTTTHPAHTCLAGSTFEKNFKAVVPVFCGP